MEDSQQRPERKTLEEKAELASRMGGEATRRFVEGLPTMDSSELLDVAFDSEAIFPLLARWVREELEDRLSRVEVPAPR